MNSVDRTDRPLVSVVIPTYKREVRYISRALNSVLRQSYRNLDIVVIDDSPAAFPDREAVRQYMEAIPDPRVRYIQNETNLGGSQARNRGIDAAKGAYICFLDDDDEYFESKIEKQLAFTQAGDYDCTLTDIVMVSAGGKVTDYRAHDDISGLDQEGLLHYHLMKHLTGTSCFLFRADKLREIGGFEPAKMGQEFFLMLKAIERGLKVGYLHECLVRMNKDREEAITAGKNKITGEISLYERKKAYFPRLNRREIRFINFRHWAVMVVAYKRNRMLPQMLLAGLRAFLASPGDFITQVSGFLRRVRKNANINEADQADT